MGIYELLQHQRGGFEMSLEYCHECDKMIDTDYDAEHEHFDEHFDEHFEHFLMKICNNFMKGGKDGRKSNR